MTPAQHGLEHVLEISVVDVGDCLPVEAHLAWPLGDAETLQDKIDTVPDPRLRVPAQGDAEVLLVCNESVDDVLNSMASILASVPLEDPFCILSHGLESVLAGCLDLVFEVLPVDGWWIDCIPENSAAINAAPVVRMVSMACWSA